jgi:hypothetical protein
MAEKLKKYGTIGCCGIDCGLCPRFYTKVILLNQEGEIQAK